MFYAIIFTIATVISFIETFVWWFGGMSPVYMMPVMFITIILSTFARAAWEVITEEKKELESQTRTMPTVVDDEFLKTRAEQIALRKKVDKLIKENRYHTVPVEVEHRKTTEDYIDENINAFTAQNKELKTAEDINIYFLTQEERKGRPWLIG